MNNQDSTALAVIDNTVGTLEVRREPEVVLAEAQRAAAALKKVLNGKEHKVMLGDHGEQYLEFEDWQTLGKFYGVTVRVTATMFVSFDLGAGRQVSGFEAKADAIVAATGQVISSGEAMCLNDEEKWSERPKYEWQDVLDKDGKRIWNDRARGGKGAYEAKRVKVGTDPVPLYQLRSMAQTRACAKAFRNCLSWVVVLAGYRPTPAEELDGEIEHVSFGDQGKQTQPVASAPRESRSSGGRPPMRTCPQCHVAAVIKGNEEFGGGWVCWKKKGGCGATFLSEDELAVPAAAPTPAASSSKPSTQGNRPKPGAPF